MNSALPSLSESPIAAGRGPGLAVLLDDSDVHSRTAVRRILYSSEGDITSPHEPTTTCLGAWKPRPVNVDKYVDNNIQEEAVNFENAIQTTILGEELKIKHAIPTQNVFRHVIRRAKEQGMKVNTSKTGMICVSDSLNYKTSTFILDANEARIETGERLKVLGWHFSPDQMLTPIFRS